MTIYSFPTENGVDKNDDDSSVSLLSCFLSDSIFYVSKYITSREYSSTERGQSSTRKVSQITDILTRGTCWVTLNNNLNWRLEIPTKMSR